MTFPAHLPKKLALATDKAEWVVAALKAGCTLSDSGMWLGGVDNPQGLIRQLRKQGMGITTTRKRVQDAAGEYHNDLAWKLTMPKG